MGGTTDWNCADEDVMPEQPIEEWTRRAALAHSSLEDTRSLVEIERDDGVALDRARDRLSVRRFQQSAKRRLNAGWSYARTPDSYLLS